MSIPERRFQFNSIIKISNKIERISESISNGNINNIIRIWYSLLYYFIFFYSKREVIGNVITQLNTDVKYDKRYIWFIIMKCILNYQFLNFFDFLFNFLDEKILSISETRRVNLYSKYLSILKLNKLYNFSFEDEKDDGLYSISIYQNFLSQQSGINLF
jgi:hypothetical protein